MEYIYSSGLVSLDGTVRVIAQVDELVAQGSTISNTIRIPAEEVWKAAPRNWGAFQRGWLPVRLLSHENTTYAVGMDGTIGIGNPGVPPVEEHVHGSVEKNAKQPFIRDAVVLSGQLVVVGMARQNFKRQPRGGWEPVDPNVRLKPGVIEVAGFNGVDGVSIDDFWAVGFGGEIWHFVKGKGRKEDSPTNVILHSVKVIRADLAYACGQSGLVLKWGGIGWKAIHQNEDAGDLWSLATLGEDLYTASDKTVYKVTEEGLVLVGGETIRSATHLASNGKMLASFGPRQVAVTKDGKSWHDITV